jgi:hypothetical protein
MKSCQLWRRRGQGRKPPFGLLCLNAGEPLLFHPLDTGGGITALDKLLISGWGNFHARFDSLESVEK